MSNAKTYHLLFNTVGALLGLFVVGYVLYFSFLRSTSEAPCSERYPAPIRFALKSTDGAPLTPVQLQARAGTRERGMLENASVVRDGEVPTGEALEVKLRPAVTGQKGHAESLTGIAFEWMPPGIAGAGSACLSYSLWLPDGFDFGGGGTLPGLFGHAPAGATPGKGGFAAPLGWSATGVPELSVPAEEPGQYHIMTGSGSSLPTGRWSRLEQEIVLNTPGQPDGVVRVWIDGRLVSEHADRAFRSDAKAGISGVKAQASYRQPPAKPGTLRLSPFEMAWR